MDKKITLITGGGSGIGRAVCLKFIEQGHQVLIAGRSKEKLLKTQAMCADPKLCIPVEADIATTEDRQKIKDNVADSEIEFLIHNAAVLGKITKLKDMTIENWNSVLNINLDAPLFLTQTLLDQMYQSRILHISSGAAHSAIEGWGAYCASKSALHMLYKVWNKEFQNKLYFGSLRPGVVDTAMQEQLRSADRNQFPGLQKFHDLYSNNELENTNRVANFIFWVLTSTTNDQYIEKEWDIRDEFHRKNWDY
ncbi:MAG: SDR family NAD(P)-dependent oxidoreductase [Calditrichae bacterium]|nr:SDR family NAD(P)-dependent oxidoreductase [Calditrichia bacterium]